MSTSLDARRKLHQHGQHGNWRFKGLLLAALPGSGVSKQDMAEAWPDPGSKGDYRFLAGTRRDMEAERTRTTVAEQGEDRFRMLSDYADDAVDEQNGGKMLAGHTDEVIKKTLFATSTYEEVDTLFREQLLETVMEGAAPRKVARDVANVINANTRRGDVPVASDQTYAPATAEGAEIRDDQEEYATVEWDTTKYGQGARVTDEMVDHAMVDVIERQIQFLGASLENRINRVFINELLDGATNQFDANGSDLGVPALNGAVGLVDNEDFMADSFVSHPEFRTALFDDTNLVYANRAGQTQELREREIGSVMGVDHYPMSGGAYDAGNTTWDYDGADDEGAVVFDSDHIHVITYNPDGNDIAVKDYEDPIRDLQGVNARVWCDAQYSQERSAATVAHSTS